MIVGGRQRTRRQRQQSDRAAGMQGVAAMVVGTPRRASPEQLWRQGMAGMGGGGFLDRFTGGAVTNVQGQLGRVELALKISTAAAVVSMLVVLATSLRRKS